MLFPRGVDEEAEQHDLKALGPRIRDKLCQHRQTRAPVPRKLSSTALWSAITSVGLVIE